MKKLIILLVASFVLGLISCQGNDSLTVDFSDRDSFTRSVNNIRLSLPEERRALFAETIKTIGDWKGSASRYMTPDQLQQFDMARINYSSENLGDLGLKILLDGADIEAIWAVDRKVRGHKINNYFSLAERRRLILENINIDKQISFELSDHKHSKLGEDTKSSFVVEVENNSQHKLGFIKILLEIQDKSWRQGAEIKLDQDPLAPGEKREITFVSTSSESIERMQSRKYGEISLYEVNDQQGKNFTEKETIQ